MVFVSNCKDSDSECRIVKQSLSVMPNASYFRSFAAKITQFIQ